MPAGPGARELTGFFASRRRGPGQPRRQPPRVVASDQHVLNLLSKRAQVLHLAAANYCWFTDPSRALCLKLAGTPAADKPLAGNVRLSALPASHPPPLPPASLGRRRHQHHRLHRRARPHPDSRTSPPPGRT